MKLLKASVLAISLLTVGAASAEPANGRPRMAEPWPLGQDWQGNGPIPRHHVAIMWGIPQPYKSMKNPLRLTQATLDIGAIVYADNCEECHGKEGLGDGFEAHDLTPPPGNLAWLSDMPMSQWDAFMYWTIAEGGYQFGTAMPAFKDNLSKLEIWAVTAYIQAHLPQHTE